MAFVSTSKVLIIVIERWNEEVTVKATGALVKAADRDGKAADNAENKNVLVMGEGAKTINLTWGYHNVCAIRLS